MGIPPSGAQVEITHGDQHATIVEVGGGIREYSDGDRAVLHPYPLDAMCDGAHGAPLVPWPNRLRDGRYRFEGVDYRVALTEPEKQNAIHGFMHWRPWAVADQSASSVVMTARLFPLMGYPFMLDLRVEYALGESGLVVTTTATNAGDQPAPYGHGQHPYLSPGTGAIDDCHLQFEALTRIETDAERQLPTGCVPVAGTQFDFAGGRRLGETTIDFAFTDLARDDAGKAWVRLTGPDARTAELWIDESFPLVELYTADTLEPSRRRKGLGTEPMSCPPNAFASGENVIRLAPGESTSTVWGARLTTSTG